MNNLKLFEWAQADQVPQIMHVRHNIFEKFNQFVFYILHCNCIMARVEYKTRGVSLKRELGLFVTIQHESAPLIPISTLTYMLSQRSAMLFKWRVIPRIVLRYWLVQSRHEICKYCLILRRGKKQVQWSTFSRHFVWNKFLFVFSLRF